MTVTNLTLIVKFRTNHATQISKGVSLVKLSITLLVILNTVCGFIQIGFMFFIQPFGFWLYPIPIAIGFILGYKNILGSVFEQDRKRIILTGILFLTNLAFFVILGVRLLDSTADSFSLFLILTTMMLVTISNFEEFGKFQAHFRRV